MTDAEALEQVKIAPNPCPFCGGRTVEGYRSDERRGWIRFACIEKACYAIFWLCQVP